MREDAQLRATEFLKELYAVGDIDAGRFDTGVDSRLEPPVPGLPLIRLDVATNIGRVHLRHPAAQHSHRRWHPKNH